MPAMYVVAGPEIRAGSHPSDAPSPPPPGARPPVRRPAEGRFICRGRKTAVPHHVLAELGRAQIVHYSSSFDATRETGRPETATRWRSTSAARLAMFRGASTTSLLPDSWRSTTIPDHIIDPTTDATAVSGSLTARGSEINGHRVGSWASRSKWCLRENTTRTNLSASGLWPRLRESAHWLLELVLR